MTDQEILEKAIQKAIDGGLPFDRNWSIDPSGRWVIINLPSGEDSIRGITHPYEQVIFNHNFAKALWGHKCTFCRPELNRFTKDHKTNDHWQYHLQQMVISEDPIKYLGANL